MVNDPISVRLKIERAEEHIGHLNTAIEHYLRPEAHPYAYIVKNDLQAKRRRWIASLAPDFRLPDAFSILAGDAVHNLRAALDHLACFVVAEESGDAAVTPDIAFPVWRSPNSPSPQELKALARGKVKGAAQEVVDLLEGIEPHPGGKHQFVWELDRLDLIDKHRLLLVVTTSMVTLGIDFAPMINPKLPAGFAQIPSAWINLRPGVADRGPIQNGTELFSMPFGEEDPNLQFTFTVAFGESEVLQLEPVVSSLTQLVQAVSELVEIVLAARP
jgi:hypothetical protein